MVCQNDVSDYLRDHDGYHKASEIAEALRNDGQRSSRSITAEVSKRCMQLYTKGVVRMGYDENNNRIFSFKGAS